jgi:hypothetical protein
VLRKSITACFQRDVDRHTRVSAARRAPPGPSTQSFTANR